MSATDQALVKNLISCRGWRSVSAGNVTWGLTPWVDVGIVVSLAVARFTERLERM
jgi:hypothetical protein